MTAFPTDAPSTVDSGVSNVSGAAHPTRSVTAMAKMQFFMRRSFRINWEAGDGDDGKRRC